MTSKTWTAGTVIDSLWLQDVNNVAYFTQAGTGAVTRSGVSKLKDFVSVKDFGAVGDGSTDDTSAIQTAITHCLSTKTTVAGALGGGCVNLYFPPGIYKVTATLNVQNFTGFQMFGAGPQSTQLCFIGSASTLFNITGYIGMVIEDMSFMAGAISFVSGVPTVTLQAARDNVCMAFNGTSAGTMLQQNRVWAYGWNKVYTTLVGVVNCDNHSHNFCAYFANNYLWDNTNSQAVVWDFLECKVFSTDLVIFNNPGLSLRVRGGDFINPGTLVAGSIASTTTDLLFDCVNLETYQNIDPARTPMFLDISGTHYIHFRDCIQRGGGSLVGRTTARLAGTFNVLVERCYIMGNWDATVGNSLSGVTSRIAFRDCENIPTVVQTLVAGQANRPLNLEIENQPLGISGAISRSYMGALSSQSAALKNPPMHDAFRIESASLNAITVSKSMPIIIHSPYTVMVTGIKANWTAANSQVCTISVWADSTKAVQLCTFTTVGPGTGGTQQYFEARTGSGLLAITQLTSTSNPLYAEISSAVNAGAAKCVLTLELTQSTI